MSSRNPNYPTSPECRANMDMIFGIFDRNPIRNSLLQTKSGATGHLVQSFRLSVNLSETMQWHQEEPNLKLLSVLLLTKLIYKSFEIPRVIQQLLLLIFHPNHFFLSILSVNRGRFAPYENVRQSISSRKIYQKQTLSKSS